MPQADVDAFERPRLVPRIQRDGHGHAGAECGQQEIVRAGAPVGAAGADRLIRDEVMTAGGDFLNKAVRTAPHHHDALFEYRGMVHTIDNAPGTREGASGSVDRLRRGHLSPDKLQRRPGQPEDECREPPAGARQPVAEQRVE